MKLEDAIEKVKPSVVQIQRIPPGEKALNAVHLGSGFLVRQLTAVVTAAHVVEDIDFDAGDRIAINFAVPTAVGPTMVVRGAFVGTTANGIRLSTDDDLALLHAPGVVGFEGFKTSVDGSEPVAPQPARAQSKIGTPARASSRPHRVREVLDEVLEGALLVEPAQTSRSYVTTKIDLGAGGETQHPQIPFD